MFWVAKNLAVEHLPLERAHNDYSLRKQPTFGDATTGFPAK